MPTPNKNKSKNEENLNEIDKEKPAEKDKHRWDAADLEKVIYFYL